MTLSFVDIQFVSSTDVFVICEINTTFFNKSAVILGIDQVSLYYKPPICCPRWGTGGPRGEGGEGVRVGGGGGGSI